MSSEYLLDKNKVKSSFSKSACSYDSQAKLQRKVAEQLLESCETEKISGAVLDIGCGTGYLTAALSQRHDIDKLYALDIAFTMLTVASSTYLSGRELSYICADAERLPITQRSLDWVFSNLAFQWCRQLPAVFRQIAESLKPSGTLAFATFGPETLKELKAAWSKVDDYAHVNHFYDQQTIQAFLTQAGFTDIQIRKQLCQSQYQDVWQLLRELQGLGAHNVNHGRNHALTGKQSLQKMLHAYPALDEVGSIAASYEIIYVQAKKKHD